MQRTQIRRYTSTGRDSTHRQYRRNSQQNAQTQMPMRNYPLTSAPAPVSFVGKEAESNLSSDVSNSFLPNKCLAFKTPPTLLQSRNRDVASVHKTFNYGWSMSKGSWIKPVVFSGSCLPCQHPTEKLKVHEKSREVLVWIRKQLSNSFNNGRGDSAVENLTPVLKLSDKTFLDVNNKPSITKPPEDKFQGKAYKTAKGQHKKVVKALNNKRLTVITLQSRPISRRSTRNQQTSTEWAGSTNIQLPKDPSYHNPQDLAKYAASLFSNIKLSRALHSIANTS